MKRLTAMICACATCFAAGLPAMAACYTVQETGLSYDVIFEGVSAQGGPLQPGDEIALLDGDLVVGAVEFDGDYPVRIPAWQADEGHGLPGFTNGHAIAVELCRGYGEPRIPGLVHWTRGGTFGDGAMSVAPLVSFPIESECYSVTPTGRFYDVVFLAADDLQEGDELALRDEGLTVGSRVFEGQWPLRIPAWKSDSEHDLPGYTATHEIAIERCRGGERAIGVPVWEEGGAFENGSMSVASTVIFVPAGACCAPDGGCAITSESGCPPPGIWHGEWVCEPNLCPNTPVVSGTWGRIKSSYREP